MRVRIREGKLPQNLGPDWAAWPRTSARQRLRRGRTSLRTVGNSEVTGEQFQRGLASHGELRR
jgi:hypothetical protein